MIEPKPIAIHNEQNTPLTPLEMLNRAVANGADIAVLERLMDLQDRWDKAAARRAFDNAIAEAKAQIPSIQRNRMGHNSKAYADFAGIAKVVDPVLSAKGLSYRFRSQQADKINVTCVLSHKDGHSEETTLSGPSDTTGNKNAVQAIGSTLTYLQRYSLMQALGLAVSNDDDGAKSEDSTSPISQEQIEELIELADEVEADKPKFCKYLKVESFAAIPQGKFQQAKDALNAKRKK